ncbi:MAG: protein kinase [Planctomycetota bacterium]|nr:protein kinase [Planctomycetota bacterium]
MPLIALVDSDADARNEVAETLRNNGYEVFEFADGQSFFKDMKNAEKEPDILITSLEIGQFDGIALTRKIREKLDKEDLPILLGGLRDDESIIFKGVDAGASDYLVKPFRMPQLLAKIHMLLREKFRRQQEATVTKELEETVTVAPPAPDSREKIAIPRRNFARYQLLGELGRGGMGVVHRARNRETGELVALKVLHRTINDEKFLGRFVREIRILKELENPYVVKVVDSGNEGNSHYLAMELIEGESTKQRLENSGPLPLNTLLKIGLGVCSALEILFENGLVHRDIKPANILITEEDQVKLVDFGLAKHHNDRALTHTGEALGTPYYLSPEAVRGGEADIRSDLYALGVTLFELATARKAFRGSSAFEVFHNIFYGDTPCLNDERDDLPEEFNQLLQELMQREIKERPSTPSQVKKALEKLQKESEVV